MNQIFRFLLLHLLRARAMRVKIRNSTIFGQEMTHLSMSKILLNRLVQLLEYKKTEMLWISFFFFGQKNSLQKLSNKRTGLSNNVFERSQTRAGMKPCAKKWGRSLHWMCCLGSNLCPRLDFFWSKNPYAEESLWENTAISPLKQSGKHVAPWGP